MGIGVCWYCDGYTEETEVRVWEPKVVCEKCFDEMDHTDLWNLAIQAAAEAAAMFKGDGAKHIQTLKLS